MKKSVLFMLFLCFSLSSSFALAKESQTASRFLLADEYLSTAKEITQEMDDPRIRIIINFISQGYAIFAPLENGQTKVVAEIGKQSEFGFLPLVFGDSQKSPLWEKIMHSERHAAFSGEINELPVVVIREHLRFSQLWMGLLMFHEGAHLFFASNGMFEDIADPLVKRALEEFMIYELEMKIISAHGGEAYAKLLDQESERLSQIKSLGGEIIAPLYGLRQIELDRIFGPALSKMESLTRESIFWLQSVYLHFNEEEESRMIADDRKIHFMLECYRSGALK